MHDVFVRAPVVFALCFLGVAACEASAATPVRGPDGEVGWYSITCRRDQGNCYSQAGEVCPHGYVTADASGHAGTAIVAHVNPYGGYAYAVPTYRGQMLIKCKSRSEDDETAEPAPDPQLAAKLAYAQCKSDYADVSTLAATWAGWFGGTALDAPPDERAFYDVCGRLSEQARVCLGAEYTAGHRDDCIATIRALPRETRHAIDHLFVTRDSGE